MSSTTFMFMNFSNEIFNRLKYCLKLLFFKIQISIDKTKSHESLSKIIAVRTQ